MARLPNPPCARDPCLEAENSTSAEALSLNAIWESPAAESSLAYGDIHLWRANLDAQLLHQRQFSEILSADERTRACRYHFERDRARFIIRRGLLRIILGRYLHLDPAKIQFDYGPRGKPRITMSTVDPHYFSLSHSCGLALYAISRDGPVGVDVERLRVIRDAAEIGARYFTPPENLRWQSLGAAQRPEAFLRCWTRKEAHAKAIGTGISEFSTESRGRQPDPVGPGRARDLPQEPCANLECVVWNLTAARAYVAALACARPAVLSENSDERIFMPLRGNNSEADPGTIATVDGSVGGSRGF